MRREARSLVVELSLNGGQAMNENERYLRCLVRSRPSNRKGCVAARRQMHKCTAMYWHRYANEIGSNK